MIKPLFSVGSFAFGRLSVEQVNNEYAELRFLAYHKEKKLTHANIVLPSQMIDSSDQRSVSYGLFDDSNLIAAIRVIESEDGSGLPMSSYLPSVPSPVIPCFELSRAVVLPSYRGCSIFSFLISAAIHQTLALGARHIIAAAGDQKTNHRFWSRVGFEPVGDSFLFRDEIIWSGEPLRLFEAVFPKRFDVDSSLNHVVDLLRSSANRISRDSEYISKD